ncbi:oligosaccharide flippase family protein [Thetidibacter halocola]|uniref:Oligosaccharide flippase family protein n=1 Tax=Thetidibacter halocola TaxID=2827239 RepID=A0A8J8B8Q3_9RHOB|nr:oligosaccharide flippase family protein [Thetidibacter halocola]MBS0123393.1 oligosaccharide flippase family protein [Thetidibacter halocola]
MSALTDRLRGSSLSARALRSVLLTVGGFGFAQVIRLASNLVLTRLLFPEAFGLMALVMVFLVGLGQFSDVGVTPAILQSRRGDDPAFLNTAWTIQVMRGFGLWLVACGVAWPLAWFYDEPQLAQILPVAALTLLIAGFKPTRMDTANRHLLLGRVTVIDMAVQIVGVIAAIGLAWATGSVWALVISGIVGGIAEVAVNWRFLPGEANRLRWERAAARELMHFGKWVFLATIAGFFYSQADKIVLGKWLPLDVFGIYNIGFFLASFPLLLGSMVTRKILIPIYRETPPAASASSFAALRRMRFAVTAGLMALVTLFGCLGVWLVDLMYDPRYALAGGVVTVLACAQMPALIVLTYDPSALAAGESRRYFFLIAARAGLMIVCLVAGLHTAGLLGALIGQGMAFLLAYPLAVRLARRMGAWDPLHDALFAGLAGLAVALALSLNWPSVAALAMGNGF